MAKKMMKGKDSKKMAMKKGGEGKSGTKPTHPSKSSFAAREKRLDGKPM